MHIYIYIHVLNNFPILMSCLIFLTDFRRTYILASNNIFSNRFDLLLVIMDIHQNYIHCTFYIL